jgi:hypothetical protein
MIDLNPVPGVDFTTVFLNLPDAPLGTMKRLESRRNPQTGAFNLRCYFDGQLVGQFDSPAIYIGVPAMGCTMGLNTNNTNPICKVDDFKSGWVPPL